MKQVYQHIDNGGIFFSIQQCDFGSTSIKFSTEYFGYPSVTAELQGFIDVKFLRDVAETISKYADELSEKEQET